MSAILILDLSQGEDLEIQMDYSIAFLSFFLSRFFVILMIAMHASSFTTRRVSPDHSSVDGYSDVTNIPI